VGVVAAELRRNATICHSGEVASVAGLRARPLRDQSLVNYVQTKSVTILTLITCTVGKRVQELRTPMTNC
jgi:hypothetical protein